MVDVAKVWMFGLPVGTLFFGQAVHGCAGV
jgi:hypothetical protein